tara:strand:+ start:897 stop:1313 length:417 start_codon:yes stop_codon:yes gene_type:complete
MSNDEKKIAVTWRLGDDSCSANGIAPEDEARYIVVTYDGEHELDSTPRLEKDAEAVAARLNEVYKEFITSQKLRWIREREDLALTDNQIDRPFPPPPHWRPRVREVTWEELEEWNGAKQAAAMKRAERAYEGPEDYDG